MSGPPLPPKVEPGDRVRLVSPASLPTEEWLDTSVEILESWGLVAEVGEHAMDEWGSMAGRDDDRLADLNDAFRDPGVRAVITTRGGAGASAPSRVRVRRSELAAGHHGWTCAALGCGTRRHRGDANP